MALLKRIFAGLIIPMVLSIILHCIFIAGACGLGVFVFVNDLSDNILTATLISDNTSRPLIAPKIKPRQQRIRKTKTAGQRDIPGPEAEVIEQASLEKAAPAEDNAMKQQDTGSSGTPVATETASSIPGSTETAAAIPASPQAAPAAVQPEVGAGSTVLSKFRGERLTYSLYWFGIHVGNAELEAAGSSGMVIIKSQVHSTPVISAFYKVDDRSESMVVNGVPVNFRIKQQEGKYSSDKETIFDRDKKHVTFFNYRKGTKDDYPIQSNELWDLISGFYYIRTQPFEVGKTIRIDIFDSNKFFQAEVYVIGKEQLKFSEGKTLDTVKVKPVLKSEGLFQNKGDILIWLTDDDNKTPVKVETKVPIGKVVAILKKLETEK